MPNEIHIIPINDSIVHRGHECECDPHLDPDGMWIHHSADKREQYERQGIENPEKPWGTFWADENENLSNLEC